MRPGEGRTKFKKDSRRQTDSTSGLEVAGNSRWRNRRQKIPTSRREDVCQERAVEKWVGEKRTGYKGQVGKEKDRWQKRRTDQ